jgi:hypothetical protein
VVCLAPRVPERLWARGACPTWSSGPSTSPLGDSVGARFEVREVLRFTARRKVVLAGRVLDGIARSGQTINFKVPDGHSWSAKIASVEFVDRMFAEPLIGLLCDEGDPREATLYAELCPPGTVVELSDAAAV